MINSPVTQEKPITYTLMLNFMRFLLVLVVLGTISAVLASFGLLGPWFGVGGFALIAAGLFGSVIVVLATIAYVIFTESGRKDWKTFRKGESTVARVIDVIVDVMFAALWFWD